MITFDDGPAAGHALHLSRAPLFLRVVLDGTKVDALDRLDDQARPEETLYAYRRRGEPSSCFWDGRDPKTGRRTGGVMISARYALVNQQPTDTEMRNNEAWRTWAKENAK